VDLPAGFAEQLTAADAEDARRAAAECDPETPRRAALWYAGALGWPVFPLHNPIHHAGTTLCSCGEINCKSSGKHPRTGSGFKDATTDPIQVNAWWRTWPAANIGTPTGLLFDVIDIDGPSGYTSYFQLRDAGALPPILARAMTGRGQHLLIPPEPDNVNNSRLLPGLDMRAAGGYIVAPPSLHICGRRYRWDDTDGPLTLPTAPPAA
jgi:hypothetical protein